MQVLVAIDGISAPCQMELVQIAKDNGANLRIGAQNPCDWNEELRGADILFGWPPAHAIEANETVRFFQLPSSGWEAYNTAALQARPDFILSNARGVVAIAVAEHALALLLALTRNLSHHILDQRDARWERAPDYRLLAGANALIVGMGAIGTELARRLRALGMHVTGMQRTPAPSQSCGEVVSFDHLDARLQQADFVILTMAALPDNTPLLTQQRLALLAPDCCLINVGRGSLVDERALTDALVSDRIRAAALDVFLQEPIDKASPLWRLPNLIVTPHVAGRFSGEIDALARFFAKNLRLYLSGEEPSNVVLRGSTQSLAGEG